MCASFRQACKNHMCLHRSNIISTICTLLHTLLSWLRESLHITNYLHIHSIDPHSARTPEKWKQPPLWSFQGWQAISEINWDDTLIFKLHWLHWIWNTSEGGGDICCPTIIIILHFTAVKVIRGYAFSLCKIVPCPETQRRKHAVGFFSFMDVQSCKA